MQWTKVLQVEYLKKDPGAVGSSGGGLGVIADFSMASSQTCHCAEFGRVWG